MEIIIGIISSTIIASIAYNKKSLNRSGMIAAIILGSSIFVFGGIIPFILMLVFFISSIFKKASRAAVLKGVLMFQISIIASELTLTFE